MSVGPPGTYSTAPKILARGYKITGDVRTGLHATVPYLVAWQDAVQFAYNALQSPSAVRIGLITWNAPYQLPLLVNGIQPPLYCNHIEIEPCGASGNAIPTGGINPPEFFTFGKVTLSFDNVIFLQNASDDPNGLNQLDPANPITACKQQVKMIGKVATQQGSGYTYDSGSYSGKPVPGPIALIQNEVKLLLTFPRVPYLPWQLFQQFASHTNDATILACNTGSLLLEAMDTEVAPSLTGFNQSVQLQFAFNPDPTGTDPGGMDWNSFPIPDGSGYSTISAAGGGGQKPYTQVNFGTMFQGLSF